MQNKNKILIKKNNTIKKKILFIFLKLFLFKFDYNHIKKNL